VVWGKAPADKRFVSYCCQKAKVSKSKSQSDLVAAVSVDFPESKIKMSAQKPA